MLWTVCVLSSEGLVCVEWVGASVRALALQCSLLGWVETSCVCGTPRGKALFLHTEAKLNG